MIKRAIQIFLTILTLQAIAQGGPGWQDQTDPQFLAFLRNNYPQTLDQSNRIIPMEAAKITGAFDCSGRQIINLDGIQFFTGIQSLNASNNKIVGMPPLFQSNKIETLQLQNNQLSFIPGLNALYLLKVLDVSGNRLNTLPNLDNLTALEILNCLNNNLVEFPGTRKNLNLKQVNISNNKISQVPDFSANKRLVIFDFSNNNFTQLPDLSNSDSLSRVDIRGNNFTFRDLTPYQARPGFKDVFVLPSERKIPIGRTVEILENHTYVLSTNIDRGVNGVLYSWYQNGVLISAKTSDSLVFADAQFKQSGKYHCVITNASYTPFKLITDTFNVVVNPCLTLNSISMTIIGSNCNQEGSVKIKYGSTTTSDVSYTLKSSSSGSVYTSKEGIFEHLTEPAYQLTVKKGSCVKFYPEEILVPIQECIQAYLTLNDDGEKDFYSFTQKGTVKIYNTQGILIKTLDSPANWDGSAKSNAKVPPGFYVADVNGGETLIKITVVH